VASGCSDEQTDAVLDALRAQQETHGWGPDACAADDGIPSGTSVGERLSDTVLKTCGGADVAFSELCGADALWVAVIHAWCPSCRHLSEQAEALHTGYAGQNVASVQVLIEWGADAAPNAEQCAQWRKQYGQDEVLTFYDPERKTYALFDEPLTALNLFVDRQWRIDGKLHSADGDELRAGIDAALAAP